MKQKGGDPLAIKDQSISVLSAYLCFLMAFAKDSQKGTRNDAICFMSQGQTRLPRQLESFGRRILSIQDKVETFFEIRCLLLMGSTPVETIFWGAIFGILTTISISTSYSSFLVASSSCVVVGIESLEALRQNDSKNCLPISRKPPMTLHTMIA